MSVPASTVSVFAGPVIRTWRIGPRRLAVTLSHNTILGTRSLAVDGEEVAGTAGTTSVFSSRTELSFVADAWAGRVVVERAGGEMRYECLVRAPGEAAEMAVAEENSPGGGGSAGSAADLAAKLRVNVAAPEGGVSEGGEPVVYYEVSCMREADGRGTKVHRRFRDFFALNDAVRSAYQGSQLLGSLPEPPPRGFKFLENHADANFVEKRRWLLADFLYKLESVPRMRQNADFLAFVGLVGNTRETSCFFPAKALGLSLTATDGGRLTEVSGIKPLADGSRSPAQLRGLINVGDKVRAAARRAHLRACQRAAAAAAAAHAPPPSPSLSLFPPPPLGV